MSTEVQPVLEPALEHRDDMPKNSGFRDMCPECPYIIEYGLTACEGCCGRK